MAGIFKRKPRGKAKRPQKWYADWIDENGKRRFKCTNTTDAAAAQRIANKFEADAALRRDGVIDAQLEGICDQSRRTIESHLADYEAKYQAAGKDAAYIATTLRYIREICAAAGFNVAADLSADGVNHFGSELKKAGKLGRKKGGRSSRTVQAYL